MPKRVISSSPPPRTNCDSLLAVAASNSCVLVHSSVHGFCMISICFTSWKRDVCCSVSVGEVLA
ncbi:hypothetical protein [Breoghania sp.]|uniref:hypothetical protein n=1 Tax=Breoghania sp. TaxID=2065378 RepID=UPI00262AB82E|nr:hypothetical protein [Breoghania sp.]MDJ0933314.1 hypothetical protein [Breoghania sp.]